MSEPWVTAIMLCRSGLRDLMRDRAVFSFFDQTYKRKQLVIVDSGRVPSKDYGGQNNAKFKLIGVSPDGQSIGTLRNLACESADGEVIMHWDDDDWSHPLRMAEQVELLKSSKAPIVGYRDCLFWDQRIRCTGCGTKEPGQHSISCTRRGPVSEVDDYRDVKGEAWQYTAAHKTNCVGTSMCYWREVWRKKPFPPRNSGEDTLWMLNMHARQSVSSLGSAPRMVARVHGGNVSLSSGEVIQPNKAEWRRVISMDAYCAEVMKL